MKFKREDIVIARNCTATLIGQKSHGKYVLVTSAQSFEDRNWEFKDAFLLLQRQGNNSIGPKFKVIKETIEKYPKFDPDFRIGTGHYYGHDIALAEVEPWKNCVPPE